MLLTFNTIWYVVAIACSILLVFSFKSYFQPSVNVTPGKRLALIFLRMATVSLVLFLLLDPHQERKTKTKEPVEIAILLDASESMTLSDLENGQSRWDAALEFVANNILGLEQREVRIRRYSFGEKLRKVDQFDQTPPTQKSTQMSQALEEILRQGRESKLGCLCLVTDGQVDDIESIDEVMKKYRRAGIPVYTYACGTTEEIPDISITRVRGKQILPFEPKVQLKVLLKSPGFANQKIPISVKCNDRLLFESIVELSGKEQEHLIEFKSPFQGFYAYDVSLQKQPGERLVHNNAARLGVEVIDQKIRVLYMEGSPNLTQALHDALEQDPHMKVKSFYAPYRVKDIEIAKKSPFRLDGKGRRVHNVASPESGYPKTLEALCRYDVVINSDIYRQMFTQEQLDNTVAFVEKFGGGFVMVGGTESFGAGYYDETVIDKLIPVDCSDARDSKFNQFKLEVSDRAMDHPIMQVGKTKEETVDAWRNLFPGFGGLNIANRAKPGAVVLARHEKTTNQYGKLVVFAVQQIGRGRTMAFTSDTTPAWGRRFQNEWGTKQDPMCYYRKFWNNNIRWLAADRIARKQAAFKLSCSNSQAVQSEPVQLKLSSLGALFDSNGETTLRCLTPDEMEIEIPLSTDPANQQWIAEFTPTQTGNYLFTARWEGPENRLRFSKFWLEVRPDLRELESTRANLGLLSQISQKTNGSGLNGISVDKVASLLCGNQAEITELKQRSVWDNLYVMLTLLVLLSTEWLLRRKNGFI